MSFLPPPGGALVPFPFYTITELQNTSLALQTIRIGHIARQVSCLRMAARLACRRTTGPADGAPEHAVDRTELPRDTRPRRMACGSPLSCETLGGHTSGA